MTAHRRAAAVASLGGGEEGDDRGKPTATLVLSRPHQARLNFEENPSHVIGVAVQTEDLSQRRVDRAGQRSHLLEYPARDCWASLHPAPLYLLEEAIGRFQALLRCAPVP